MNSSYRETCRLSLAVSKPNTLAFNWKQGLDRVIIRLRAEVNTHTTPTPFCPTHFSPLECAVRYHHLSFAGPYGVRQSNEQKMMLDPKYSLKKVAVKLQADITTRKSECKSFINQSLIGWGTWIQFGTPRTRLRRDLTGWFRSGMAVLNSIDQEV